MEQPLVDSPLYLSLRRGGASETDETTRENVSEREVRTISRGDVHIGTVEDDVVTVRESYPIPTMDGRIGSFGYSKVLPTLDCNSGYCEIPLEEEERDKKTFTCHGGLYHFTRTPFVFAPRGSYITECCRYNPVEGAVKTALMYIYDVIIYSRSIEEYFLHTREVLAMLYHADVTLQRRTSSFFADSFDYMAHTIRPGS